MFVFVYANVAYTKLVEKLNKPKEGGEAEADAAAS